RAGQAPRARRGGERARGLTRALRRRLDPRRRDRARARPPRRPVRAGPSRRPAPVATQCPPGLHRRAELRLQPNEIASILREQIEKYEVPTGVEEVGTIIQLSDGIARVYGLESCVALEMTRVPYGIRGVCVYVTER